MNEKSFKEKDLLVMKLLHYFITEKGYNPIILHGVQNEIWLENLDSDYRIVRIMMGYIHNNEQYDFDVFKTKKIMQKIKIKTLSLKMNSLSIFVDLGESVELNDSDNMDFVNISDEKDISKSEKLIKYFPDIKIKTKFNEKDAELFTKITNDINAKNKKEAEKADEIFKIKKPKITQILIILNVFIFFLMYLFGNGSEHIPTLLKFGALTKYNVLDLGEYYRIITSSFLHIGIFHLFFNMYALHILGSQVETFFKGYKYLIIYLYSALFGSLMSLLFMQNASISAGASGAIFGLLGAMLYFGYHYRSYLGNSMIKRIVPVILINLFIGFSLPGIDNAAHIGGLIGGIIISNAVGIKYKTSSFEKNNGIVVSILSVLFLIYMIFFK